MREGAKLFAWLTCCCCCLPSIISFRTTTPIRHNFLPRTELINSPVSSSSSSHGSSSQLSLSNKDNNREDLYGTGTIPTTSFGAEAVPEGQRPANEYLNLVKQPLFKWANQENGNNGLLLRLGIVYMAVFTLVSYPVASATFTRDGYFLQKLAAANVGSIAIVLAIVLRLYSGWGYVGHRLKSKVVEYEETGWYDGNFEIKSPKEKARDLLLYRSDVKPVKDRLKLFGLATAGLFVASCIGLNVATSANPMFDEYDVAMLERLQYDDKLADVAARESGGKPVYCDNRYYRAIANGGQGCN